MYVDVYSEKAGLVRAMYISQKIVHHSKRNPDGASMVAEALKFGTGAQIGCVPSGEATGQDSPRGFSETLHSCLNEDAVSCRFRFLR